MNENVLKKAKENLTQREVKSYCIYISNSIIKFSIRSLLYQRMSVLHLKIHLSIENI